MKGSNTAAIVSARASAKASATLAACSPHRPPRGKTPRAAARSESMAPTKRPLPERFEALVGKRFCETGYRIAVPAFFGFCASAVAGYMLMMLLFVFTEPALAQDGAAAVEPINNFLTQVRNGLAALIAGIGGIAMLCCCIVWMLSGSNEKRRERVQGWMANILIAMGIGLAVPVLIGVFQALIPQGGGGGGQ